MFQFKINGSLLARCSRATPQKLVNDIMHGLFDADYLANHSLTGFKSSKGGEAVKPGLPVEKVHAISC
jgi:hypothetical protein